MIEKGNIDVYNVSELKCWDILAWTFPLKGTAERGMVFYPMHQQGLDF